MSYIRKRIFRTTGMVFVVLCVLSLSKTFEPEQVKAGVYDNAYTFYQKYGNEMAFLPGANNQGEIYYATKGKKHSNTGVRYTTLGWKVRVFNHAGALVETLYYKLDGSHMKSVDTCTVDGYEYCLFQVTLKNIKSRLSKAGLDTLSNPDCEIVFDACITTRIDGVIQGGMTDEGPSWGNVYTTYNGIVYAANWSSATRESLKSYYNKNVEGLFYDVNVSKEVGIRQVSGAGRYCFGTTVTVSAETEDGYHFSNWSGDKNSTNESFSFVLHGSDVSLTANAAENVYHIVFDSDGAQGSIPSQVLKYSEILLLPSEGYWMEGSALSGWRYPKDNSVIQFYKGQIIPLQKLVKELQLQETDGATITLYASWDHGPLIKTEAIYVSLKDAIAGKITEDWLAKRAEAFDQEDGEIPYGRNENTSFFMEDYQVTDFTEFQKEGRVTETFFALDSAGNATRKEIEIHVVDTQVYPTEKILGRVRFITKKYFMDESGNLIEEEMGGLEKDSIWRLEEEYLSILKKLFN